MSSIKMQFFAVDALHPDEGSQELNAFLASHRILAVTKELVRMEKHAFWAFCIEYSHPVAAGEKGDGKKDRVDYKEVLTAEEFSVYSRLRDLRKKLAEAKGVPAYAIFTNAQLAEMVQGQVHTRNDLLAISGVGDTRVAEFGDAFLSSAPAAAKTTGALQLVAHQMVESKTGGRHFSEEPIQPLHIQEQRRDER